LDVKWFGKAIGSYSVFAFAFYSKTFMPSDYIQLDSQAKSTIFILILHFTNMQSLFEKIIELILFFTTCWWRSRWIKMIKNLSGMSENQDGEEWKCRQVIHKLYSF